MSFLKDVLKSNFEKIVPYQEECAVRTQYDINELKNKISFVKDLDRPLDFLKGRKGPIYVVGNAVHELTSGLLDRVLTFPEKAREIFSQGTTLECDFMDLEHKELRPLLESVLADYGFPAGTTSKSVLYVSKSGNGFAPHFDAYTNIIFQISGKKLWKVAKNKNALAPLEHFDLGMYPIMSPALKSYWKNEEPKLEVEEILLEEGECLFLPRGVWHETEASEGDSISLNFTISVPTQIDLVLSRVRAALAPNEKMRAPALGLDPQVDLSEAVELLKTQKISRIDGDLYQESMKSFRKVQMLGKEFFE